MPDFISLPGIEIAFLGTTYTHTTILLYDFLQFTGMKSAGIDPDLVNLVLFPGFQGYNNFVV